MVVTRWYHLITGNDQSSLSAGPYCFAAVWEILLIWIWNNLCHR